MAQTLVGPPGAQKRAFQGLECLDGVLEAGYLLPLAFWARPACVLRALALFEK